MTDVIAQNSPKHPSLFHHLVLWFTERSMNRQAGTVLSHTSNSGLYDMGLSRQDLHRIANDSENSSVRVIRRVSNRGPFRNPF